MVVFSDNFRMEIRSRSIVVGGIFAWQSLPDEKIGLYRDRQPFRRNDEIVLESFPGHFCLWSGSRDSPPRGGRAPRAPLCFGPPRRRVVLRVFFQRNRRNEKRIVPEVVGNYTSNKYEYVREEARKELGTPVGKNAVEKKRTSSPKKSLSFTVLCSTIVTHPP